MGIVIEGYTDVKKERKTLYQNISQAIIKLYYTSKKGIKFDKYLQDAVRTLKIINLIETRSEIELERYNNTQYPSFLWQEKINQKLHFFASMIGFIDDCTKEIDFYSHFDNKENEINEYEKNQSELLEIRNSILQDLAKRSTCHDPHILISTLETVPAHKSFTELYNDSIKNGYQLDLQQELVSAYNVGYTSFGHYDLDLILDLYKKLTEKLEIYEDSNENVLKKEQGNGLGKALKSHK